MSKRRLFYGRRKVIFAGGIYHVTQRATGAEPLFLEQADYLYMLHLLKETVKKYNLDLFAFTLMSNHLHLLLRINGENLKEAMHNLFTRYGIYFNSKYERKGHVFCDNYRAAVCLSDSYLLTTSLYIHANPYRAKLTKKAFDYRWSSLSLFTGHSDKIAFVNHKFILKMLDKNLSRAADIYKKMILEFLQLEITGAADDFSPIKRLTLNMAAVFHRSFANKNFRQEAEFGEIIKNLTGKKRIYTPTHKNARFFVVKQLLARGYSVKETADLLKVNRLTIYRLINEAKVKNQQIYKTM
ncbi:MAG TPA: hypothetical protein ENN78_00800 [Candidatus Omnitrophica bacterium]|nr:hypothetical protein [Candidatus Omnitrophota bacterium]